MKINIYFLVNAEFYRVVWTINALLTVRSEMLPFSGNNQNIKMFGVPPEHFAIGYVYNDNLPLGNIALQYIIPNNCRKVWWCFLMISCTFWRSRKHLSNSPKLSCGFHFDAVDFNECRSKEMIIFFWHLFTVYVNEPGLTFIQWQHHDFELGGGGRGPQWGQCWEATKNSLHFWAEKQFFFFFFFFFFLVVGWVGGRAIGRGGGNSK